MDEFLPIPVPEEEIPLHERYDGLDNFLSESARTLRSFDRAPRRKKNGGYDRQRFLNAVGEAFELVGGVPRLAIWADQNYGDFLKIVGKTLPSTLQNIAVHGDGPVQIICPIQRSPLDDAEDLSPDGKMINVTPMK
jgi:hypothetical protein